VKTRSNNFNLIGLLLTAFAIYAIGVWMGYRVGSEGREQQVEARQ